MQTEEEELQKLRLKSCSLSDRSGNTNFTVASIIYFLSILLSNLAICDQVQPKTYMLPFDGLYQVNMKEQGTQNSTQLQLLYAITLEALWHISTSTTQLDSTLLICLVFYEG